ncbi:MAG TPA: hypothetical protein VMN36_06345, partial [Verrucomicrobiales bacterium]|nr:hypothetical protein [Verrucomicrobiales bacterium]
MQAEQRDRRIGRAVAGGGQQSFSPAGAPGLAGDPDGSTAGLGMGSARGIPQRDGTDRLALDA